MAGFPQREVVGTLEDEEDEEDARFAAPQDEISDERHVSLPSSLQPWAKDAPAAAAGKYHTPGRPRATLEDDEMSGMPSLAASDDPLGDVMDWLAFADLGEDDPARSNQVGTYFGDSPGTPSAASPDVPVLPSRSRGSRPARAAGYCGLGDPEQEAGPPIDPEEEEWDVRQRQTGAAGRLVTYNLGERPDEDVHLRGGGEKRLMVAGVKRHGKAEQAGVKSGDVLVSIDGKKDFAGLSAEDVHRRLRAPVTLVFMGFVGKLQAEVRLNYKQRPCGLASKDQVAVGRPDAPLQVVDEVVFQPTTAPLFLAVNHEPPKNVQSSIGISAGDDGDVGDVSLLDEQLEELGVEFTGPILAAALEESNLMEASASAAAAAAAAAAAGSPPEVRQGSRQGSTTDNLGSSFKSLFGEGTDNGDSAVPEPERATPKASNSISAVYELRGQEARSLVTEALERARPMAREASSGKGGISALDTPGLEPAVAPSSQTPSRRPEESSIPELLPFKQFSRIGGFVQDGFHRGSQSTRATCDEGLWQTPFGGRCERKTGF